MAKKKLESVFLSVNRQPVKTLGDIEFIDARLEEIRDLLLRGIENVASADVDEAMKRITSAIFSSAFDHSIRLEYGPLSELEARFERSAIRVRAIMDDLRSLCDTYSRPGGYSLLRCTIRGEKPDDVHEIEFQTGVERALPLLANLAEALENGAEGVAVRNNYDEPECWQDLISWLVDTWLLVRQESVTRNDAEEVRRGASKADLIDFVQACLAPTLQDSSLRLPSLPEPDLRAYIANHFDRLREQ